MSVANVISDLVLCVDYAKTLKSDWAGTFAAKLAAVGAPNQDDYGRLTRKALDITEGHRVKFASMLAQTKELADEVLQQLVIELDRNDVRPDSSPEVILGIGLREWMVANSKVFESRGVTHNAASAVTGTGDGVLVLYTDDDQSTADTLEAATDGTLTFTCEQDQGTGGSSGAEAFNVYDELAARDVLEYGGTTRGRNLAAICATNVSAIANADFEAAWGSTDADTGKINSWTATNPTSLAEDTTNYFRGSSAVKFEAAATIAQAYTGLPHDVPVHTSLQYNRSAGTGTGSLLFTIGAKTTTVTTLSTSGAGWNRQSQTQWPKRFTGGSHKISIEVNADGEAVSGYTVVDEVIVAVMERIGGRYLLILAGATDFLIGDYFTQDTSIGGAGLNKDWLHTWYGLNFELPHSGAASAGWEDPA